MQESQETELRAICPFCQSLTQTGRTDGKFYVNLTSGLYYCFHCGEKGRDLPDDILGELNVIDEIAKRSFDPSSLAKLQDRSPELDQFTAERLPRSAPIDPSLPRSVATSGFPLLYSNENQAVALPIRNFSNEIVGIKYRKIDPEAKPRYLSEIGSLNEGAWYRQSDGNLNKLLIVEGELDALTALLTGFQGSVLATQTNRIHQSQLNHVKAFKNVFILPDNDLGGTELENSCNELLGALKPTIIHLSNSNYKDLNEVLTKGGYDECCKFIRLETQTAVERDTRSLSQCVPELLSWLSDDRHRTGDSSGWPSLDAIIGKGFRASEMSVVNSFAKVGKSSFVNNLINNLAKNGKKIGLASFEMPPHSIFTSLITIAIKSNLRNMVHEDRQMMLEECTNEYLYLENVTMLQRFGYTSWKDIEEWSKLLKSQQKLDYLVLDHAGFMVKKMTDAEENQELAKNIKRLTNELGIHVFVVVQAPKTKDGLSIQSAYGGMAWAQNCDNFFTLERDKTDEQLLKVRLEAARYPGSSPSNTPVHLSYQRDTLTLIE